MQPHATAPASTAPARRRRWHPLASRRTWLWLHRWAGLFMALFLVVAGLTGSVIAFHEELDRWLNPRLFKVEPRGEPLSPIALQQLVQQRMPHARINTINLRREPDQSAIFWLTPRRGAASGEAAFTAVYLDPYTGEFLGGRDTRAVRFDREHILSFLYELHYTMALPEPWGRWLFGFVALLWTLDCFVGFYLTLPRSRRAFARRWKPAWLVKWSASPVRINFDLHRAAALWTWVMLLVLAVSSVQLNLQREVFDPVFTTLFPVKNVREQLVPHAPPSGYTPLSWENGLAQARELMAARAGSDGFIVEQETSLGLSTARGIFAYRVRSSLDIDNRYGRTMLYFSAVDGKELAFEHPRMASGNLVLRWLAMLHFGHVWGLPFRIFVCLMGLIVALLSITGVLIWWRKRRSRSTGAASRPLPSA